jgi:hypothetical protein
MLLVDVLVSNWDALLAVLTAVQALALAVVHLTPTPTDNERLKSVYSKIELLAGLVTHKAKQ